MPRFDARKNDAKSEQEAVERDALARQDAPPQIGLGDALARPWPSAGWAQVADIGGDGPQGCADG
eukprot:228222-Heterocapsa_arctica.AAC.1